MEKYGNMCHTPFSILDIHVPSTGRNLRHMERFWAGAFDRDAFAMSSIYAQFCAEHHACVVSTRNRLPRTVCSASEVEILKRQLPFHCTTITLTLEKCMSHIARTFHIYITCMFYILYNIYQQRHLLRVCCTSLLLVQSEP